MNALVLAVLLTVKPPVSTTPWSLREGACRIVYQTRLPSPPHTCIFFHETPTSRSSVNVRPGERLYVSRDRCTVRVEPDPGQEPETGCTIAYDARASGKLLLQKFLKDMNRAETRQFCRSIHESEQRFRFPLTDCQEPEPVCPPCRAGERRARVDRADQCICCSLDPNHQPDPCRDETPEFP